MTIRLLIVDDHDLVREGLRMTFAGTDIEVVAEAADGQDAFDKLSVQPVDVALVDVRMPRADGYRFLELLRQAGMTLPVVLMHTVDEGMKSVRRCQELGAQGLVVKGRHEQSLRDAIHKVHAGQSLWGEPTPEGT